MTDWEGFFRLHDGLPREGPGDRATLDWALGHANLARINHLTNYKHYGSFK